MTYAVGQRRRDGPFPWVGESTSGRHSLTHSLKLCYNPTQSSPEPNEQFPVLKLYYNQARPQRRHFQY